MLSGLHGEMWIDSSDQSSSDFRCLELIDLGRFGIVLAD